MNDHITEEIAGWISEYVNAIFYSSQKICTVQLIIIDNKRSFLKNNLYPSCSTIIQNN